MTNRQWLYDKLISIPNVQSVIQGGSLRTANIEKPYVAYHMGNITSEVLADDEQLVDSDILPNRSFFQIWVHDDPADYDQIDQICHDVIRAIRGQGDPTSGIMTTRYLETSQDLTDATLGTICRYIRFQFVRSQ